RDVYAALGREIADEEALEAAAVRQAKAVTLRETRAGLEACLLDKQTTRAAEDEARAALARENASFNDMKAYLAAKRKDVDADKASATEALQRAAASVSTALDSDRDAARFALERAFENAHAGRAERRAAAEAATRAAAVAACLDFRQMKISEEQAERDSQRARDGAERESSEHADRTAHEENARRAADTRARRVELSAVHLRQMAEAKDATGKREHQRKEIEKAVLEVERAETDRFHAYATAAVSEFAAAGRDLEPILGGLRRRRPFPPMEYSSQRQDTFERLGFALRRVPAHPAAADPWRRRRRSTGGAKEQAEATPPSATAAEVTAG
ncbi:hypothetical protein HK405_014544, partial [Cladochytrium tenue]